MVVTDEVGRMLFCGATTPGSTADITQARRAGLVTLLKNTTGLRILADATYQGLGARTAGQVIIPSYRKFRTNPPAWYEEICTRQRKAHSSRRIRVEYDIVHLKNWRSPCRHLGHRETFADTVRAVAGHQHHDRIEAARPEPR